MMMCEIDFPRDLISHVPCDVKWNCVMSVSKLFPQ